MAKYIPTDEVSAHLRVKGLDLQRKAVLITNFSETEQSRDFTVPSNCNGFGRIHHFRRFEGEEFPENPLPIDPACNALGIPYPDLIKAQVFQNAVCGWRCWYCFVDYKLLSGNQKYSFFKTAEELITYYLAEEEKCPVIDLSGGQPDLIPEWSLWVADEIMKQGLNERVFLWSDDNLSNGYLWEYLTPVEVRRLASYKYYGRVGCFKGFDDHSFSFNTGADPELFKNQFKLMRKLVDWEFNVYGYITLTSDDDRDISKKMEDFFDEMQSTIHPNFPLRTIPLRIKEFTPTRHRMDESHYRSIQIQKIAVGAWNEEIEKRFSREVREKRIFEHAIY